MTNSLSTYPIRVAPIGPSKGMSEIVRAAEAPLITIVAVTSVIQSPLFITTDPFACRASLPVSMLMSESPMRCLKDEVMKNQSPILWREK